MILGLDVINIPNELGGHLGVDENPFPGQGVWVGCMSRYNHTAEHWPNFCIICHNEVFEISNHLRSWFEIF
jgi:hypothetical protein